MVASLSKLRNIFILLATSYYIVIHMPETEVETVQREVTSIKVKPDIWKEARIEAIRQGKTVSELVEEAIDAWIREHRKEKKG